MQNLKKSDESRGVVVFAFNTTAVDYVGIADQSSRLIEKKLNLPITLVTDSNGSPEFNYDNIIRIDPDLGNNNYRGAINDQTIAWRNFGRYLAYDLSPYNETILLDTDYLVLDNSLLKLFEIDFDYQLMHYNESTSGYDANVMGNTSLPFVWATVILFRKTERSRMLFNLVGRIQRNYSYYRGLYNITKTNFRNDYAFTIANNILNGYSLNKNQSIPWSMLSIYHEIDAILPIGSLLKLNHTITPDGKFPLTTILPYQNIHILDKNYLLTSNFKKFVDFICE
jgi:hypothetical protein